MTNENITRRNQLMEQIANGNALSESDREWLRDHPIISTRYGEPFIIADFLPMEPGKDHTVTISCQNVHPDHPIVPTFTVPFEKGGYIQLTNIVNAPLPDKNMKQSTKLSFRMLPGITAAAQCRSDAGVLMVSYQGWVRDSKPFPLWFECVRYPGFAMMKEIISDNMISYSCCGADGTEDAFQFLVNWYAVE